MVLNLNSKEKILLLTALSALPESKERNSLARKIEKSLKPIQKRSAKAKGHEWQKEICEMISRITNIPFNQADDTSEIKSREASLNGVDVILTGEARRKFPYAVECKNSEAISLPDWVRQAESNSETGEDWLLFIKSSLFAKKKIAVLPLPLFEHLATKAAHSPE